MTFTHEDVTLLRTVRETLQGVLTEKRARGEYFHANVDAKLGALDDLARRLMQANDDHAAAVAGHASDSTVHARRQHDALAKITQLTSYADDLRRENAALIARATTAEQRAPYDPEPDQMLDWIEREPWGEVRMVLCPQGRQEHGSLRDAIRHELKRAYARR